MSKLLSPRAEALLRLAAETAPLESGCLALGADYREHARSPLDVETALRAVPLDEKFKPDPVLWAEAARTRNEAKEQAKTMPEKDDHASRAAKAVAEMVLTELRASLAHPLNAEAAVSVRLNPARDERFEAQIAKIIRAEYAATDPAWPHRIWLLHHDHGESENGGLLTLDLDEAKDAEMAIRVAHECTDMAAQMKRPRDEWLWNLATVVRSRITSAQIDELGDINDDVLRSLVEVPFRLVEVPF